MSVYSREERMKAVKLYFQYDRQVAPVLRELGDPSRGALRRWVAEFEATGDVHAGYRRERHPSKYSEAQKTSGCRLLSDSWPQPAENRSGPRIPEPRHASPMAQRARRRSSASSHRKGIQALGKAERRRKERGGHRPLQP